MIQKIADLPQQQQIVLAVLAVAGLGFFWFYMINEVSAEIGSQRERIVQLTDEVEAGRAVADRLPQFELEVGELEGQL
ncbi:MAG: hypothetical protein O7G29_02250, partial [Acidobacteria bacterium]|nr:hypothetical protein [Acidobacteriota bacterium]